MPSTYWEAENIMGGHNYIGEYGQKQIGGTVREVGMCGFLISDTNTVWWTWIVIRTPSWLISISSMAKPIEMDVLLFGCMVEDIQRGGNWIIKFALLHQNLVEHGSFRTTAANSMNIHIRRRCVLCLDRYPSSSVRALADATGRSRRIVHCVLQGEALHPFHVQRVQLLQPDDPPPRAMFALCC